MKILFIYPNAGSQPGFNYGVAHISAVLKKAGHKVEFWQLCEEIKPLPIKEEFTARLKETAPDIIGFSVVTNQWQYARDLASWSRQAVKIPLVCGGIHATIAADEVLQTGLFDYVFRGESEDAFLEFVERVAHKKDVGDIRNIGLVRDEKIIVNPLRSLPSLKDLPFKDYEIFNFQEIIDAKNGWVGLMASRGCPFACAYCFNHQVVHQYRTDLRCSFKGLNYIRHHTVDQIIYEIEYLLKNFKNIKTFIFDDDLFTYNKQYLKEFCKAYEKTCDIPFVVNAHIGYFDEDRARYLAAANCRIVKFGVESGSDRVRHKILNRHMSNEKIIKAIQVAHGSGLHTSVFLMIGLPYEKHEDVMDTIRLMGKTRPGRFRWTFFYPFPGTKAHQLSVKGGFVDFDKMDSLMNFTDASCLNFGPEQNFFLEKVGLIMPWLVNAYSGFQVSDFYEKKVREILAMDQEEWKRISPCLHAEDKKYSDDFVKKGLSHYAVKYNRFMGVISDYFIKEE